MLPSLRQFRALSIIGLVLVTLWPEKDSAALERRRDQYGREFSYYVYPIAGEIPGLGSAVGLGTSVLNMADTDTDVTGYYLRGDFNATGLTFLDVNLIPRRLIFDVGYNDYQVVPTSYDRGMLSDPDDYIQPSVDGAYLLGQLTLTFDERRYELFARALTGKERFREVLNAEGEAFPNIDTSADTGYSVNLGGSVDLTDDRLDPRRGLRFEYAARLPRNESKLESEYFNTEYNLTGFLPGHKWDTIVFNLFHSRALITRHGETDYATLQQEQGLNCDTRPPGPERDACLETEAKFLNQAIAENRYGTTTPLGGTQRLRSYDNYRFYAGQAMFYGVEYRWNLTDEYTPFNIYIAKGIRTGIQLAAFWERGTVAERWKNLWEESRTSYGVGFRLVLTGVVIRLDYADGDEGPNSTLFITYPWSMFSVDNPG